MAMEPELKGVVIISLPPPDDPSQGKTITAFTFLSNPFTSSQQPQTQTQQPQQLQSSSSSPPLSRTTSSSPLSFLPSRTTLAALVGFTLLASSLLVYLLSDAPIQFLEENSEGKRREENSFWLPLYPKLKDNKTSLVDMGGVKLGSVTGVRKPVAQSVKSDVDSSVVIPLRGNIFPDGYCTGTPLIAFPMSMSFFRSLIEFG